MGGTTWTAERNERLLVLFLTKKVQANGTDANAALAAAYKTVYSESRRYTLVSYSVDQLLTMCIDDTGIDAYTPT